MNCLKLAVVARNYPSVQRIHNGIFVQQTAQAMAQRGAHITVIAPQPIRPSLKSNLSNHHDVDAHTPSINVLRPSILSFSNIPLPIIGSTARLSTWSFVAMTQMVGKLLSPIPDCCYGHFLYPAGVAVARLAQTLGIPAVVAMGEGPPSCYESVPGLQQARRDIARFDGIIAVSGANRDYAVHKLGVDPSKITVIHNAVDTTHFYPRDRQASRIRYGLPLDVPIVAFVGGFEERKGPLRVAEALKVIPDVKAIFLGAGQQRPEGPQVLFAGSVPHAEVPHWLSATDVFVLPTLAEGCPNVVLEAMACGLPVISSDLPFNHEIVDSSMSIFIDPMDITALSIAIRELVYDDQRRKHMGAVALERASKNTIQDRARHILHWIQQIQDRYTTKT